jgi:hypothetical protein
MNRNQWLQIGAGLAGGYLLWKYVLRDRVGTGSALAGPIRMNPKGSTYKHPVSKTPRSKATSRCIFGRGSTCRFPVGDAYHERKALQYVQAGRCTPGECEEIVRYLARKARDPEVRRRARQERGPILQSAYRAKRKRRRSRARRVA